MGFREGEEEKSKQSSPMYLRGKSEVQSNRNIVNPPAIRLWRPLWLLPDIQNWCYVRAERPARLELGG